MSRLFCDRFSGFNGKTLKWIAMWSMFFDHMGLLLFSSHPLFVWFRTIGRLAFPIFCFLLVEGFLHTSNRKRYGQNLLFFAILSEPAFQLAVHPPQTWFPFFHNVFFELFFGLLLLTALQKADAASPNPPLRSIGIVAFFACLTLLLQCDYHAYGMIFLALLYWYRTGRISLLPPTLFAALFSAGFFCAATLSMPLLSLYNGTRGRQRHKYAYYWFYPVHLLLLSLIAAVRA